MPTRACCGIQPQFLTTLFESVMSSSSSLLDLDDLPEFRPFPTVATRVMAACDDPDSEASEVASIVKCDPAMAMRILSAANSSMYGFASEIVTIEQAIVVMGFRAAKNFVLSIAASAAFLDDSPANKAKCDLWQHSLACAAVARLVAQQVGVSPDEAFLASVVHDVGKLVFLDVVGEDYCALTSNIDSGRITAVEMDSFGVTHAELGERYACEWGLPGDIIDAIACHHEPESAVSADKLAGVICVANSIAISLGLGCRNEIDECVDDAVGRSPLEVDASMIQGISENARTEYEAICKVCA